ncbi:zinc ABC transporter substrate-binding protein [Natrinema sp. 1APR25-10V2]|uniref:metal ABC transporter substrate-binding protein n=1 Tax=Natrinema sp. 1APR25-10V2 TaxID=2951081 RepID=UPI00287459D9|nr:zinc ABC transporter substrate-binding protein [Natrinema sp. 1APR25-10V2]MDS0477575.1 zinc ABC transporter substrate-binding protein [Natrinema sp. 1APR25-10V2]
MKLTRRALVGRGVSAVAAGALAGCLDDIESADRSLDGGYAAFFTLWDWAQRVSGDTIDFENPVGTGQAGHGWSPSGDLTRNIADAGVFVYFDTPEFSWAQDIAATLEADYDTVAVIDGLEGLEDQLLGWNHEVETGDHSDDGDDDGNHSDGEHDDQSSDGHGHDESSVDPHVWLDPVLAGEIVGTIADGLADADPDNAETYEENAAAYTSDLEDLDRQFEEVVDAANRRTAVYAGHDSFTYLQERYGFEVHTPVGVAPQEEPSPNDISETIDLVDSEGIETILYNPFEAVDGDYPLVDTIIAESGATDAMPITHLSGTLATWQDEGWGYAEQMQEINLPAFREALDAQ